MTNGVIETGEGGPVCSVWDPEAIKDNPVEAKHRRLVRSHRNGPLDRDLKPNAKIRDELNVIHFFWLTQEILIFSPTQELTSEEKDLLWKFRFYLTRDKRALTKFLKCVVWTDPTEVKQATELLSRWTEVDVDDALELLGPTFRNKAVRAYAVERLRKADDDVLSLSLTNQGTPPLPPPTRPSSQIRKHNNLQIHGSNPRLLTRTLSNHSIHPKPLVGE
jgi:phosphatidylinositol 3-kinase